MTSYPNKETTVEDKQPSLEPTLDKEPRRRLPDSLLIKASANSSVLKPKMSPKIDPDF